jgi:hypothetical protein
MFSATAVLTFALLSGATGAMQGPAPAAVVLADTSATAIAKRAEQSLVIDGRDRDAVWQTAPKISDFTQFSPARATAASQRTEFRVAYDDRHMYLFVRAFFSHPYSIMRALARRDQISPSEQITVFIDSYNDNRSAFEFQVNPDGVKLDYALTNDNREDDSWNAVWDVATQVDSLGWTAEFSIPLSQLRYTDTKTHKFGLGVWRYTARHNEQDSWPSFDNSKNGIVSQFGALVGVEDIASSRAVELTPYTVAKNETRGSPADGWNRAQKVTVGGDLKYGITPNITLDATVNPDFGQVEADPANLNLSAFETFLSERRPFFVEGTGLYQFQLNCYIVVDCQTNEGLFYSRRIGRSPLLRDVYGDASTPTATPILGAMKLTGRTAGGLSFGVLDALTPTVQGLNERTAEPTTNYAVVRAQQDLRSGKADISVIATGVNRSLDEWTTDAMHSNAYAAGASFRNRFGDSQYEIVGQATWSRVAGSPTAITRTQRNAVHYFQQPGDDATVDTTATSLDGHAEQIKFGKYGGGLVSFETSVVRQSAGFEVNDLGYLRRADRLNWSTWSSLVFRTPRSFYNRLQFNGNHWETWNTSGLRLENAWNANSHINLKNNWNIHGGGTLDNFTESSFCDRCTRGGPAVRQSRGIYPWFGVNGDNRKFLSPSMWVNLSYGDEGKSHGVNLSPSATLRFSTNVAVSLGANFSDDHNDVQWYDNITDDAGVTHYTFGHLDQKTVSMNMRVNYTVTPDLTFEFYGEPFTTTGSYTNFREVSSTPDAKQYEARYTPYAMDPAAPRGFSFMQLRTNAVARWEYRPGSTLFLVWAHGRQDGSDERSDRTWRADYRHLFDEHPDNTFLIKVAYWLSR